ncbi:hypothetical protein HUJ05_003489 [Dendroctonus ponderosae]|nr:hypothetical protein HUJ05_003489 [Dendroctonus ponderosae]
MTYIVLGEIALQYQIGTLQVFVKFEIRTMRLVLVQSKGGQNTVVIDEESFVVVWFIMRSEIIFNISKSVQCLAANI